VGVIGGDGDLNKWGKDKKTRIASPEGLQAAQFMVDLTLNDKVTQPNPVNAGRDEDLQPLFMAGKLAIVETGSWFPAIIGRNAPDLKFDVMPLPVSKPGLKSANVFWPDAVMMYKQSKNKEAAAELLKFMYSKENRLLWAKQRGVVPERTDVGQDPQYATSKF